MPYVTKGLTVVKHFRRIDLPMNMAYLTDALLKERKELARSRAHLVKLCGRLRFHLFKLETDEEPAPTSALRRLSHVRKMKGYVSVSIPEENFEKIVESLLPYGFSSVSDYYRFCIINVLLGAWALKPMPAKHGKQ